MPVITCRDICTRRWIYMPTHQLKCSGVKLAERLKTAQPRIVNCSSGSDNPGQRVLMAGKMMKVRDRSASHCHPPEGVLEQSYQPQILL